MTLTPCSLQEEAVLGLLWASTLVLQKDRGFSWAFPVLTSVSHFSKSVVRGSRSPGASVTWLAIFSVGGSQWMGWMLSADTFLMGTLGDFSDAQTRHWDIISTAPAALPLPLILCSLLSLPWWSAFQSGLVLLGSMRTAHVLPSTVWQTHLAPSSASAPPRALSRDQDATAHARKAPCPPEWRRSLQALWVVLWHPTPGLCPDTLVTFPELIGYPSPPLPETRRPEKPTPHHAGSFLSDGCCNVCCWSAAVFKGFQR